jgi:hypothetical protein
MMQNLLYRRGRRVRAEVSSIALPPRVLCGLCGELTSSPQNLMPLTDNLPLSFFILTLVYTRGGAMLKSFIDGMAQRFAKTIKDI